MRHAIAIGRLLFTVGFGIFCSLFEILHSEFLLFIFLFEFVHDRLMQRSFIRLFV